MIIEMTIMMNEKRRYDGEDNTIYLMKKIKPIIMLECGVYRERIIRRIEV